jgi:predicted cation transporter
MSLDPPPIKEPIAGQNGELPLPWIIFFDQTFTGDTGDVWTPTFTDLTVSGTPTITGRYYKLSQELCYFSVTITPATNTSATAGTTYINNFPLTVTGNGVCFAVSGNLGDGPGMVVAGNNRIYVPSWTTVTVPLTVVGIAEAQ